MTEEPTTPKRRRSSPPTTAEPAAPTSDETVGLLLDETGLVALPDGRRMTPTEFSRRLTLLTQPFAADQIEKLPKQIEKSGDLMDCKAGTRASADGVHCGGRHRRSVHLDYVGHAGITMRLNEVDPLWDWEFLVKDEHGRGVYNIDAMWITLTVLGITHKGFGSASGKSGGDAVKELIGDALRNAAMRFGVATYLWSKSDESRILKAGGAIEDAPAPQAQQRAQRPRRSPAARPSAEGATAPQAGTHEPARHVDPPVIDDLRTRIVAAADRLEIGTDRDSGLKALWDEAVALGAEQYEVFVPQPWHAVWGSDTSTIGRLVSGARQVAIDSGETPWDDEPRADMTNDEWAVDAPADTEGA